MKQEFNTLKGLTISTIAVSNEKDHVIFQTRCGREFVLFHVQDCCESVQVEEVIGELKDIIGEPILLAEEVSKESNNVSDSGTWTFYKLSTIKGSVTIRWLGQSNGYYSERVDFMETTK